MGNQSSSLHEAASSGDVGRVGWLIKKEKVPVDLQDQDGWAPLHFAAWRGQLRVVRELLDHNASVDVTDKAGRTPLHLAALNSHPVVAAFLCDKGARVDKADENGMAAVHKAATSGSKAVMSELLNHGADPNLRLPDGTTPAHLAAWKGFASVLQLLIDRGADVRAVNKDGQSPLHEAAGGGHKEVIELLLSLGADAHLQDMDGHTPATLALKAGHGEVADIMAGGNRDSVPGTANKVPRFRQADRWATAASGPAGMAQPSAPPPPADLYPDKAPNSGYVAYPSLYTPGTGQDRKPEFSAASATPLPDDGGWGNRQQPALNTAAKAAIAAADDGWGNTQLAWQADAKGQPNAALQEAQRVARKAKAGQSDQQHPAMQAAQQVAGFAQGAAKLFQGAMEARKQDGLARQAERRRKAAEEEQRRHAAGEATPVAGRSVVDDAPDPDYVDSDDYDDEQPAKPAGYAGGQQARSTAQQRQKLAELEADIDRQQGWARGGTKHAADVTRSQQARLRQQQDEISALQKQLENAKLSSPEVGQPVGNQRAGGGIGGGVPAATDWPTYAQCQLFGSAEIRKATDNFAASNKLGSGGFGAVYKGTLGHTPLAVKQLAADGVQGSREFQAEVEVLSRIRHPHVLLLIGACPSERCLVYELMQRGSLEDALRQKGPGGRGEAVKLSWADRLRVATEITAAVQFLHSARPRPILHHDIKPANVLLDRNLTAKLGDVGLARLAVDGAADSRVMGTMAYACPEYMQSGQYTAASDVYALGITFLQILTGRDAQGVVQLVERAVERRMVHDAADRTAGAWPADEATAFAKLALRCVEYRQRDRPGLERDVLPQLSAMAGRAEALTHAAAAAPSASAVPPTMFVCPITQELMDDPVVAADGYTYERDAIEAWLDSRHVTSPMTNQELDHTNLTPNHGLRSAILEWKQGHSEAQRR